MKKIVAFLFVITLVVEVRGQDALSGITIPGTPAFSILNFEPSSVMRPNSSEQLKADLLNSFDKDGKLLANLGIEVLPYWLKSRPKLTRSEYLSASNWGNALIRSISVSAATVKDSGTGNNNFGFGLRFRIVHGKPQAIIKNLDTKLDNNLLLLSFIQPYRLNPGNETKNEVINAIINFMALNNYSNGDQITIRAVIDTLFDHHNLNDPADAEFITALENAIDDIEKETPDQITNANKIRQGWTVDLAGASGFESRAAETRKRIGVWINANRYLTGDDILTITGRALFSNGDTAQQNVDIGIGYLKKTKNFNISFEAMARYYDAEFTDLTIVGGKQNKNDFTYRIALQAAYHISPNISLNLSIGKEFDSPFYTGSSFLSIFGLNYTIFSKTPASD